MRTKDTLKNSIISMISFGIIAILGFVIRKIFVINFSTELLGYEGLFSNVLALLSLADLGIENVILYRLFPAYANDDEEEVGKIMTIYGQLYRWVGSVILVIGICLIPFLKVIIKDNSYDWNYVYIIYVFQLIINLSTYFLAYRRIIYSVSQRAYECVKIDTAMNALFSVFKIISIVLFRNYFLYLLCGLGINISQNLIINIKAGKDFKYIKKKQHVSLDDIKEIGLFKDLKNNIVQKVSLVLYGSTDYLVVTFFLGVTQVGFLTNYTMVINSVNNLVYKIIAPFQMSIGNYIYTEEDGNDMFRMFDFLSFLIASVVACCYFCLFQPFIQLWLGTKFLLGTLYLSFLVLNEYIHWNHQFLTYYRNSFGKYELDRGWILGAAILNLVVSIVLAPVMGVAGVMLGTAIGHLGFWIGRAYVVHKEYLTEPIHKYIFRQIVRAVLVIIELFVCYSITKGMEVSVISFVIRMIICVSIPLIIDLLVHIRTIEMKKVLQYSNTVLGLIKKRN